MCSNIRRLLSIPILISYQIYIREHGKIEKKKLAYTIKSNGETLQHVYSMFISYQVSIGSKQGLLDGLDVTHLDMSKLKYVRRRMGCEMPTDRLQDSCRFRLTDLGEHTKHRLSVQLCELSSLAGISRKVLYIVWSVRLGGHRSCGLLARLNS